MFRLCFLIRVLVLSLFSFFSVNSHAGWGIDSNGVAAGYCYSTLIDLCTTWDSLDSAYEWRGETGVTPNLCKLWLNGSTTNFKNVGGVNCDHSCSAAEVRRTNGYCSQPPKCADGQTYDSSKYECSWPSTCPAGQSMFTTTYKSGAVASKYCVPTVDTPAQKCISYEDMQTDYCKGKSETCSATGGTFGNVNGKNICIPANDPNQLPTCAAGQVQFIVNSDGSSSATCAKPYDANPTGVVTNTLPTASAGQQQANIANNTAALAGITQSGFQAVVNAINAQGKNVAGSGSGSGTGEEAPCTGDNCKNSETKHSASGGDGCDAPPTCDGDQIMCTALKVSWQSKCAIANAQKSEADATLTELGHTAGESQIPFTSIDTGSFMSSIYGMSGASASCPSLPTINLSMGSFSPSLNAFCDFAEQLRPLVLLIFGFIAFRIFVGGGSAA